MKFKVFYLAKWRFLLIFFLALTFSTSAFCQTVVTRYFLSKFTLDTVKYKVWIPRDWSPKKKYLSIYVNDYGALGNNSMLVAADINNFINEFPQTVVVEITSGNMDHMDYNYETGMIGTKGKAFVSTLREDLIPAIEKDFNTTKFKAFIGQSFSASYANYLFLNEPGLFNAYILFTPEQLNENQPPFEITDQLKSYYDTHPTLYYISPAGKDMERRKKYALDIKSKVQKLDTSYFHFQYQIFDEADHNTIVSFALMPALKFIFSRYDLNIFDGAFDVKSAFIKKMEEIKNLYGLDIPRNSWAQSPFLNQAADRKDKNGMDYIASYFQDSTSTQNSLMLFNTGYVYFDTFRDDVKAEKYFKMSIESAKKVGSKRGMMNGYSWLASMYWDTLKNSNLAWKTMQEAFDNTQSAVYKYKMGALSAASGHKLDDGIIALKFFLANPVKTFPERQAYKEEGAYLLLSKCYYKKKELKMAKYYLNESLLLNKDYDQALQWKAEFENNTKNIK